MRNRPRKSISSSTKRSKNGLPKSTCRPTDRKSTRLNSSHLGISYAVFCLKKKKKKIREVNIRKRVITNMSRKPLITAINSKNTTIEKTSHSDVDNRANTNYKSEKTQWATTI